MSEKISRRSVTRAGVWGIPAITLAAATPAFATSTVPPIRKDPGINGWVLVNYGTSYGFNATFDSDPAGTDPASPDGAPFGLYLYDTQPGDEFSAVSITLWFRGTVGSWTYGKDNGVPNGGGHGRWGRNPKYVGHKKKPDGLWYHGYQFKYEGTFSNLGVADGLVWLQDFEATAKNVASGDATFWVERHIAINGEVHAFQRRNGERGSMGVGFPSASSRARSFAHPSGVTGVMA